ncbi:MAG TPA: ATP-dependent metallopeptidase FtsH/Yme1/Tma family protein, partial [Longimicrobiales bacterium]
MTEERRTKPQDRRKKNDRRGHLERRRGVNPMMGDRRTRFSVAYFIVAFLLLIALNFMLSRANTKQVPYSEFKARIQRGEVKTVFIGEQMVRAEVQDSLVRRGSPEVLTARPPVHGDESLVPLLESKRVTYDGVAQAWLPQLIGWLLPLGILILFWFWMLRRMNPAQGVMTIGKNRA